VPNLDLPQFPDRFLWGTAIAAQQVEHQSPSDWAEFENRAADGRIRNLGEYPAEVVRKKADFDRLYDGDFAQAESWGHNALRLSISWSRLFPREGMGEPDPQGVAFYRRVFDAIKARGLEPFVTLFHFESPAWFWRTVDGRRGWERPDAIDHFSAFASAVVEHFGGDIEYWCTLNEPMVYLLYGYIEGVFPPLERRQGLKQTGEVLVALLHAHRAAWRIIKNDSARRSKDSKVGIATHTRAFGPYRRWNPLDRLVTVVTERAFLWDFVEALRTGTLALTGTGIRRTISDLAGTQDYVGINYYSRCLAEARLREPVRPRIHFHSPDCPAGRMNDLGWESCPRGFYRILCAANRRFGVPIYVLENGTADGDDDDRQRQAYIVDHVREMWNAIQAGVDVRGYFHWTLTDNFEWAEGFEARFGLMRVDYRDGFRRTPRPSAEIYAEIARRNSPVDVS